MHKNDLQAKSMEILRLRQELVAQRTNASNLPDKVHMEEIQT